jgi:hypothetical protein
MVTRTALAGRSTLVGIAALLLSLLLPINTLPAQPLTMNGALELTQLYRPGAWQPVRLELRNDGATNIDGEAVLPLADETTSALMKVPLMVPAHAMVRVTVWGYFPRIDMLPKNQNGNAPPLSTAEWRSRDGSLLGRTPIFGLPLSAKAGEQGTEEFGAMVLLVNERSEVPDEEHDLEALAARLSESSSIPLAVPAIPLEALTRQPAGLRPMCAVVFDSVDPQALDFAQREAVIEYVRGGGTLIVSAPIAANGARGTWLESLLPVRLIGVREASQVEISTGGAALKLNRPQAIVEATEGNGNVLLRSGDYVHVAEKQFGLGKVVFTSFAINALAPSQPQVTMLWEQLLALKSPSRQLADTQLSQARHAVLGSMIGRKVAPWGVAGALAGGYLMVILLAQGIFFGASRPKAAIVSATAAVLLSGTLLAMSLSRHGGDTLQSARLDVLDVTGDGGGTRQESLALIGVDDPSLALQSADEGTTIRPALADRSDRPVIRQQPFAVEKAGVYSQRIERVWEAAGRVDLKLKLDAIGRFDEHGLSLEVNNELGKTLEAPLLISQRRALSMKNLPSGTSSVNEMRLNPRADFTNTSMVTSEQATRRGAVLKATLTELRESNTRQREESPTLAGWIDEDATGALVRPLREVVAPKSMVMVRTPVRIEAPKIGAKVQIPAALVQMDTGRLLYDLAEGQTYPSQQSGQWLVRFFPPPQVGALRTTRATVELRIALPAHKLSISKGQISHDKPKVNRNGETIGEWTKDVGLKHVTFDCGAGDIDRDGGVWLLFDVSPAAEQNAGTPVPWQMKELSVAIEGEVTAPPKDVSLEEPLRPISAPE